MNDYSDQNRNSDPQRMPRRGSRMGRRGTSRDASGRGYYGEGYGEGESPYTSYPPDYNQRMSTGESPYTDYGPRVRRRGDYGESPYTNQPPASYSNRYGSGESPYTDYGSRRRGERDTWNSGDEEDQGYDSMSYTYTEIWMVPGPYSGMGPQGYQRSDDRILEDISNRLMLHGQIDARNIMVNVQNGEVTLSGTVQSRQEKRMAEDIADSVAGVKDVQNNLKIQQTNQPGG